MSEGGGAFRGRGPAEAPERETCPRCGTFATLHRRGDRRLCESCLERTIHPIAAAPTTPGAILAGVLELFPKVGPKAALVAVAFEVPLALWILFGDPSFVVSNLWALVALIGNAAVVELCLQHLDRDPRLAMARALSIGARSWFDLVLAYLAAGLIVAVFLLLLIVPGIVRALSYALILPLIVSGEARGVGALGISKERMKGHRWAALFAYVVAASPSLALLAIYFLMGAGLQLGMNGTPLDRAEGTRILDATYTLLYPLFELPTIFVSVVLYAKLQPRGAP